MCARLRTMNLGLFSFKILFLHTITTTDNQLHKNLSLFGSIIAKGYKRLQTYSNMWKSYCLLFDLLHTIQVNSYCQDPVKYFTDRSKAVLLLWIFYVFVLSCVCYVFVRVCLYVLCGHLLGKG